MIKICKSRLSVAAVSLICLCGAATHLRAGSLRESADARRQRSELLSGRIAEIAAGYPGEIGVAVIIDNTDTIAVNNRCVYPMMSVFKLHQALAVCDDFDRRNLSLDTVLDIRRETLDPRTWSPMMKDYSDAVISLPVRELLRYTLIQSDNNASNVMFSELVGTAATDSLIATIIPRQNFRISYTEKEMSVDHDKAYDNRTSPLGAAMLVNRLFTDTLVSFDKQRFIMETLEQCSTGKDRIAAPLLDKEGVRLAHKTGSGYTNEKGELVAHNDVGYIWLPNGVRYALAVFVKDFKGDEREAAKVIAGISAVVYASLTQEADTF